MTKLFTTTLRAPFRFKKLNYYAFIQRMLECAALHLHTDNGSQMQRSTAYRKIRDPLKNTVRTEFVRRALTASF